MRAGAVIAILVATAALAGCGGPSITFHGWTQPKTESVDVYFGAGEVTRPHQVIGVLRAEDVWRVSGEEFESKFLGKARRVGADGVVVASTHGRLLGADVPPEKWPVQRCMIVWGSWEVGDREILFTGAPITAHAIRYLEPPSPLASEVGGE